MACIFALPFGLKGLGFQQEVARVTLHGDRLHAREQRSESIIAPYFQAYYRFWQFTRPEGAKIVASREEHTSTGGRDVVSFSTTQQRETRGRGSPSRRGH